MKIAMCVNNDFSNDERVLREAKTLLKNGHTVTVICVESKNNRGNETREGISVIRVKPMIEGMIWRQPIGMMIKYFSPIFSYGTHTAKQLFNQLQSIPADIYHAHDLDTLLPCYKAAKKNNSKLVYDSHELFVATRGQMKPQNILLIIPYYVGILYLSLLEKILIKKCNLVITVNHSLKKIIEKKFGLHDVLVIVNSQEKIVLTESTLRSEGSFTPKDIVLIYQGVLGPGRALEQSIAAMNLLPETYKLMLLGSGAWQDKLKEKVSNLRLTNRVIFHEYLPHDQLLSFTSGANLGLCLIEPINKSKMYALPNKFFEYLSSGVPLLVSNIPELNYLVNKYQIGAICQKLNEHEIASQIKNAISSPDYQQWKINCKTVYNNILNWDQESKKLARAYESLRS